MVADTAVGKVVMWYQLVLLIEWASRDTLTVLALSKDVDRLKVFAEQYHKGRTDLNWMQSNDYEFANGGHSGGYLQYQIKPLSDVTILD
jgi:hypothetical protein